MRRDAASVRRQAAVLMGIVLMGMLCSCSGLAEAGWFVPENRIAWQAWRHGDDVASLQHWDNSSKGMYGRATVLLKMGRLREAERGFRQALDAAAGLKPAYIASIWYNLGNCLYRQGDLQAAREAWRQALGYHPGHVKAAHNLALLDALLKQQHSPAGRASTAGRTQQRAGKKQQQKEQQMAAGSAVAGKHSQTSKTAQGGGEDDMTGLNRTKRQAAAVRDSMDLFLKHRLAEKSAPALPSRRGEPW